MDQADLVIVGGGTVGGWASWFAHELGAERIAVLERGLVGAGASSRAAGVVRAQGGTPDTVTFGSFTLNSTGGSTPPSASTRGSASSAT